MYFSGLIIVPCIFVLVAVAGVSTQQFYQWQCSALDSNNNVFYFPNINENDIRGVQFSQRSAVYIYPVPQDQVNCSGTVSAVEFCHSNSFSQFMFTLLVLEQSGLNFTIINAITLRSAPNHQKCFFLFCCDTITLDIADQFPLPTAFGTLLSNATLNLYAFHEQGSPQYRVEDLFLTTSAAIGDVTTGSTFTLTENNRVTGQTLRLLRFTIKPEPTTPETTKETITTETTTTEMTTKETTTTETTTTETTTPETTTTETTTTETTTPETTTPETTTPETTTTETTTTETTTPETTTTETTPETTTTETTTPETTTTETTTTETTTLPQDRTSALILAKLVESIDSISVSNLTDPDISSIVNKIDLLLSSNGSELSEVEKNEESGQEVLLEAVEDFSKILANGTLPLSDETELNVTGGENINIKVQRLFPATENSILFDLMKDADDDEAEAELHIPPEAIPNNTVVVVIVFLRGLARLLDSVVDIQSDNAVISIGDLVTINILAEQEGVIESVTQFPENNPVVLRLPIGNVTLESCVWWNTTARNWSDDGIRSDVDEDSNTALCSISHLTSFSVLVSPTGFTAKTEAEETALSVVSYVGCIISSVFLILTIISLIWFRKTLNKGPLLYVHLNLSIALLISLLIFVSAVERATTVYVLCVVTTSLLHYFLLASFCWMLCEGILLYLMVVRVFGTAAKKWYWFLPLGWGLPVPVVTISAGVLEGSYDSYTHYPNHCWLKAGDGAAAIWTFIVPMVIIIIINAVILVMTLCSIIKSRRKGGAEFDVKKKELAKTAIKSLVFLLPLMGVTWVIGLFAVEENTTVFAWLFTIFNSLQGASIFILHVARNEGFQRKLLTWFKSNRKTSSYGTTGATIFSNSTKVASLDSDSSSSNVTDIKEDSLSLKRLT